MGIYLKCKHCEHDWVYSGKQKFYAQCPMCMYKVNITKCKIIL